jgi:hypothetical protein
MRIAASFWAALLLGGTVMAANFTGTWNANLKKSTGDIGNIASYKVKIEEIGPNAYRTTLEGGGRKITMKEDGKVVEVLVSSVSKDGKPSMRFWA